MTTPHGDDKFYAIIGVDPGKVTGLAMYVRYLTSSSNVPQADFEVCAVPGGAVAVGERLSELIHVVRRRSASVRHESNLPLVIAVERFTMGGRPKTSQTDALEVIGVTKWVARWSYYKTSLVMQGASESAKIGTRQALTAAGWWTQADKDQQRNRAAAQVAAALLRVDPDHWYDISRS